MKKREHMIHAEKPQRKRHRGKAALVLLLCLAMFALTGCDSSDYKKAVSLYENEQYEEALALFEALGDYEDSQEKAADAQEKLMFQKYGDVIELLKTDTWYFNGGSDTTINGITFSDKEATIRQMYADKNGVWEAGNDSHPFIIDDSCITLTLADGTELEIPYAVESEKVRLGNGDYYTSKEVEEEIQGCWFISSSMAPLGINSEVEDYISFNNGVAIVESISDFSGKTTCAVREGTYTMDFGWIKTAGTAVYETSSWSFNIIDGKVTVLYFGRICTPVDALPDPDNYTTYYY